MEYNHILIRYGELGLKGKNMKQFINKLQQNVQFALRKFEHVKVTRTQGRMIVGLNGEDAEAVMSQCQKVFGISSLSLAIKVENDEEAIKQAALASICKEKNIATFKVSVRRANKSFPIPSQEMNRVLGGHILRNTDHLSVNVHNPDVEVNVDIREKATFITAKKILGLGGLPVGSGGKSLVLLSGGIDSPVAAYLMMKRGVQVEMIHFHSPPFTSERAKQKVIDVTKELCEYSGGKIKIHFIPFTKLQQEIFKTMPERYGMTIMRRMMVKIAEKVCQRYQILAMTTGESVGQVASQTLASMNAINEMTNLPVLRPLLTFDKDDIINISKDINTYDISIRPYEDCCTIFVPKSPATNPKREKINFLESKHNFTPLIDEAVEGLETMVIDADEVAEEFSELL